MKKNSLYSYASLLFILIITIVSGCSGKKKDVVAEIGDEKVYLYEFENQYLKSLGNNADSAAKTTIEQRKEFLDLIVKLKLKVKDAKDRGLLNSPEIQKDIKEYQNNFISSFLIDKEIVEPNIKELWDRKQYEVRASHIMVNLSQTPTPDDSIKAYLKADTILQRLRKGEDFSVVAREMSDDQTAKTNNGDLYYFTGGMTVPEFDDAVYTLKVGEYTKKPIRTMFGLHIVKLTDKKKRYASVRAAHILIQDIKDTVTGKVIDSLTSLNKIKDIYTRIKNGEDFGKLATEFSEDPGSKSRNGDLGFFDRRRMVQPFDSAVFSLKPGQLTDIVRTPYGWHIIKLLEVKEYEPFDKQKENLKSEYKRTPQFKNAYDKFVLKAKTDYKLEIDKNSLSMLVGKLDSTKQFNSINLDSLFSEQDKQMIIAKYDGGDVKVLNMIQYLNTNRDYLASPANAATLEKIISATTESPILNAYAIKKKIDKDDDYNDLLKEYQEGLLKFKIDQEELWSKIKVTDIDLQQYYEKNKQKYTVMENNEQKPKNFDEVKAEVSQSVQQEKFNELEKQYLDNLKQKYPVKINESALMKAFKK